MTSLHIVNGKEVVFCEDSDAPMSSAILISKKLKRLYYAHHCTTSVTAKCNISADVKALENQNWTSNSERC